jgi:PEP-CTERM motif
VADLENWDHSVCTEKRSTKKAMFMRKITNLLLVLSLLLCVSGGVVTVANAGDDAPQSKPRKNCDYDRSGDEERTRGDCGGVPTPEPISIILFSAGLAGVGFAARRRLRRSE